MLNSRPRRLAALVLLAFATMVAVPSAGHAATIKACQNKKNGKLRIAKKCKKNEKRITWNTKGPKGDSGANGANGSNGLNGTSGASGTNGTPGSPGSPGQPQSVRKFAASQDPLSDDEDVQLFQADGITYRFNCIFVLGDIALLTADGPSGTSYSQGSLARPNGIDRLSSDPWSAISQSTLGGGPKSVASIGTLPASEGNIEQDGVFNAAVEGPEATTLMQFRMVAAGPCTVRGVAITVPNAS
jgi:collagen triple helix repeat protein